MASRYQTLYDVFQDVRYVSGKDSTTLVDNDLYRLANKYYSLIVRELIDINEEWFAEISFRDISGNQREYALPIDDTTGAGQGGDKYGGGFIKIQRVEVSYDGVIWKVARPITFAEIRHPTTTDTDLNVIADRAAPVYWYRDKSIWLAPVPASTDDVVVDNDNLHIFWIRRPNELIVTSDTPEMPKDFLSVLAEGILIDVFRKHGRISDAAGAQRNFEAGLVNIREKEQGPDVEQPFAFKAKRKNYK